MTADQAAQSAFEHSLEMADWLRANGNSAAGDELERKARELHEQRPAAG
jgi:hypothetical protein